MNNAHNGLRVEEVEWLHQHGYSIKPVKFPRVHGERTAFLLYKNDDRVDGSLDGFKRIPHDCYKQALSLESTQTPDSTGV